MSTASKSNRPKELVLGRGRLLDTADEYDLIKMPDSDRSGHSFWFGTTRVGKTKQLCNLVEQDIRKGYNVAVVDPKCDDELLNTIIATALEEGREKDLILITPVFPDDSAKINPLSHFYMLEEAVGHIVAGIDTSGGDSQFFYNVGREVGMVIVRALVMLSEKAGVATQFTLNDIKNYLSQEDLSKLKAQIDAIGTEEAQQLSWDLNKIIKSDPTHYGKISTSLRTALMELTTGNVGTVLGHTKENRFIERLENNEGVIVLLHTGTMLNRVTGTTLGRVFLSMIHTYVGRVLLSGRKLANPLCLFIDEAQSAMYYGVDDLFAKAGGGGCWITCFAQSIKQLYSTLDRDYAESILDNCNTQGYMRINDASTARYLSDHFGTTRRLSVVAGVGTNRLTSKETEEDRVKPEQILNLQKRRFFLRTYSGLYYGKTLDMPDPWLHILLPKILTRQEVHNNAA